LTDTANQTFMKKLLHLFVALTLLVGAATQLNAQVTAFTYQGRLTVNGAAANGANDFTFTLYDAANGGAAVGVSNVVNDLAVSNGLFTVTLDFGAAVFDGNARWLEIGVRTNGAGAFTALIPRQQITTTPYAVQSANAATAAQLSGTISSNNIGAGTITGSKLANGAVGSTQIVDGGVAAADLAPSLGVWSKSGNHLSHSAGNVGIGTTNPQTLLHVFSTNLPTTLRLHSAPSLGFGAGRLEFYSDPLGSGSEWRPGYVESTDNGGFAGGLAFVVNGAGYDNRLGQIETMRIVNGRVGIGTPTPATSLDVRGTVAASNFVGALAANQLTGTIPPANIGAGSITAVQLAPGAVVSSLAAEGLGAVPNSQAVVMSTLAADEALTSRGYTRLGNTVAFGSESWTPVSVPGVNNTPIPGASYSVWTGTEFLIVNLYGTGARYDPVANLWTPLPAPAGWSSIRQFASVAWTGTEMIIWGGQRTATPTLRYNSGFRFNPTSNTWRAMREDGSTPTPRGGAGAVWTGSRFVIWGGFDVSYNALNTGGRYDPVTDTWAATRADATTPPGAAAPATVWTGSRMVVWSGYLSAPSYKAITNGGLYDPVADTWSPLSTTGAPRPTGQALAVWTGSEMIVWGGTTNTSSTTRVSTGGRYNPGANTWSPMTGTPPSARNSPLGVWTGSELIVWGGGVADGKIYSPATGWGASIATANSPGAQISPQGAWLPGTSEMLTVSGNAGRYKPSTTTWTTVPSEYNNGQSRRDHAAVWTGTEMLFWGGTINGVPTDIGRRYHPGTGVWTNMSLEGAPSPRRDFTAVWSGSELIVWGGTLDGYSPLSDGARYNPVSDTWTPMAPAPASPQTPWGKSMRDGRFGHAAVWTPEGMFVWGGADGYDNQGQELSTIGATYQPWSDTWGLVNSGDDGLPARWKPTAVFISPKVYIFGGRTLPPSYPGGTLVADAIAYDLDGASWLTLPAAPQSLAREGLSLTAAGTRLALWGGRDATGTAQQTGLVFNTLSNTWATLPATGAPAARSDHTAVWTGRELLVWGGVSGAGTPLANGVRVELDATQWNPLPAGPTIASGHTAVWSGSEMILYGHVAGLVDQCSRYRPAINGYYYLRP